MSERTSQDRTIVSLGGGHGLFQTLRAGRLVTSSAITAVVTVADDGGSSGRIRKELDLIPPGDLRMALVALSQKSPGEPDWEQILQHRFGGHGALAGHAVGNLLISGIAESLGSMQDALDIVAELAGAQGRVLPVCLSPLDIEAEVAGLHENPLVMSHVRGQVAVASTPGHVRRVRLWPPDPKAHPEALAAIAGSDIVTLGPGSWFSSVIPHVLIPEIAHGLSTTSATTVVFLNLAAEAGETPGFSTERHIQMLAQHSPELRMDVVVADSWSMRSRHDRENVKRAAQQLGAEVIFADVRGLDRDGRPSELHDPEKVAAVLARL